MRYVGWRIVTPVSTFDISPIVRADSNKSAILQVFPQRSEVENIVMSVAKLILSPHEGVNYELNLTSILIYRTNIREIRYEGS
jgi:hypothetical protein